MLPSCLSLWSRWLPFYGLQARDLLIRGFGVRVYQVVSHSTHLYVCGRVGGGASEAQQLEETLALGNNSKALMTGVPPLPETPRGDGGQLSCQHC